MKTEKDKINKDVFPYGTNMNDVKQLEKDKIKEEIEKKSKWKVFEEYAGLFFIAIFLLICIFGVLYLLITLIENPVSLAILCVTILLIYLWSSR